MCENSDLSVMKLTEADSLKCWSDDLSVYVLIVMMSTHTTLLSFYNWSEVMKWNVCEIHSISLKWRSNVSLKCGSWPNSAVCICPHQCCCCSHLAPHSFISFRSMLFIYFICLSAPWQCSWSVAMAETGCLVK